MTKRFYRHSFFVASFFAIFLILSVNNGVQAQSQSLVWNEWDVVIDSVDVTNNAFKVTERYEIQFMGTFRFGSAFIENTNLEGINAFSVIVDGRELSPGCGNARNTYCVRNESGGTSLVYYFIEPITNEKAVIEISYRVQGAIRVYEGGDQLWWIGVPEDTFGFRVSRASITVNMPEGYAPREGVDPVVTYGAPADVQVNGTRIVATTTRPVDSDETFELRVQYPHNPDARVAGWQAGFDFSRETQPLIDIGLIMVGLIIGLGGPLGVFYLWHSRGRDPKVGPVPVYLNTPPSELRPAIVGALVDEKADMRDVLSTIIDLAHRGYVVIEESQTEGFFGLGGSSKFVFKRTDKTYDDLRPYERVLMHKIFSGSKMTRTLDSMKNKFYKHVPQLKNDLYDEMMKQELFKHNPETTRSIWSGLGVLIGFGALFFGGMMLSEVENFSPALMCLPFAFGMTGLSLLIAGQFMPAKTAKGAEETAKWNAFREYLTNLEKYNTLEEAAVHFETYLPYAVAFGIERSWMRKFKGIDSIPTPPWYYPTHRGGYWGRGYRAGTPLPTRGGGIFPGDVVTASSAGGGLDDLAGGLSGGLESLSDGLTSMLNSAGSVMNSRPDSGGSGSWSGGGGSWSGGGSFGGGGSGGGSRGFG